VGAAFAAVQAVLSDTPRLAHTADELAVSPGRSRWNGLILGHIPRIARASGRAAIGSRRADP